MEDTYKLVEQACRDLSGSVGVLYLMFLGRETCQEDLKKFFLKEEGKPGLFKKEESVTQAMKRLRERQEKSGIQYLVFLREERRQGKPKIYTANPEPFFATLDLYGEPYDKELVMKVIKAVAGHFYGFPRFVARLGGNLDWLKLVSAYLIYTSLCALLLVARSQGRRTVEEARRAVTSLQGASNDIGKGISREIASLFIPTMAAQLSTSVKELVKAILEEAGDLSEQALDLDVSKLDLNEQQVREIATFFLEAAFYIVLYPFRIRPETARPLLKQLISLTLNLF